MDPSTRISTALISSRNILLGGRTNEHVLPCLEEVIAELELVTVPSTRTIIGHCVAEAITQIKGGDFLSAGMILNLIHNLPLDESARQRWNVDYFISMELPTFLERYEEIRSARLLVLHICAELAREYLPADW